MPPPGGRPPAPPGVQGMQQRTAMTMPLRPPPKPQPSKRELDSLLEEIKAKQKLQEQKKEIMKHAEAMAAAAEAQAGEVVAPITEVVEVRPGSTTPGPGPSPPRTQDAPQLVQQRTAESTALFLREIPQSITEDVLCQLFSRYGIVTSMDIVREREGLPEGYVTLDTRENAQRAKDALQDREVDGVPLWIEWAKGPPPLSSGPTESKEDGCRHVVIDPPIDKRKRRIIDRLAKYVAQEGHAFEQIVMEREKESREGIFAFLFQHDSADNLYYRWRTFAFAQGDNFKSWRSETFRICENGAWWKPPPCEAVPEKKRTTNFSSAPPVLAVQPAATAPTAGNAVVPPKQPLAVPAAMPSTWTQEDIEEERERQRLEERATQERQKRDRDKKGIAGGKRLSDADWDKLEQLLRSVTGARPMILEAMSFCLDKSDWAIEITECITESLTIVETDMPLKLARLLVVSDILHNTCSSRPAAWAYRREFEKSLPDIFEHFHFSLGRLQSRLQADKAREQVVRVLQIWEDWGLFAPQYVRGLEAALVVGVKRLKALATRGDNSRKPVWLEPKLADWRRQHFSQLEKMCRTRGLRSSTSHLEATKDNSLEDARKDWLIDRLVTYELHWHEREQSRAATSASSEGLRSIRNKASDDIDGEAIDCDIDGVPLDDGDLDGESIDIEDPGDFLRFAEASQAIPETFLGGYLGIVSSRTNGRTRSRRDLASPVTGSLGAASPSASLPAAVSSTADVDGSPISSSTKRPKEVHADVEDVLDIERPEDPAKLERFSEVAGESIFPDTEALQPETATSKMEHAVLRNIELEVMELRASLETQGLHRDAIEDICDEKRQRLIDEHERTLASPQPADRSDGEEITACASPSPRRPIMVSGSPEARTQNDQGRDRDKEREEERDKEKEQERDKDKDRKDTLSSSASRSKEVVASALTTRGKKREREIDDRMREKEKEKEKAKEKDKAREKEKEKDRGRKEKDKSRGKDADRGAHDRDRSRSKEKTRRSRDRDRVKASDSHARLARRRS